MKNDFRRMFDLKPEECTLNILICAKQKEEIPSFTRVQFVDPDLLPKLSFSDQSFDLVLCPHVLFVHKNLAVEEFDKKVVLELARVGSEVRVVPLVDKAGQPTPHLGSLVQSLQLEGMGTELRHIASESGGSNAMLRFWNDACVVKG